MKSLTTLAAAAALALTGAGFASATPTIYHVTGSTAFRVADVTAEVNYLVASHGGASGAYNGSSLTGANTSVILSGDGTIQFENSFNGSIAGDESVAAVVNKVAFPTAAGVTLSTLTAGTATAAASGGTSVSSFTNETTYGDIAFSDVSFATAAKVIKLATSATISANSGGTVGVVPFDFIANNTSDVTDFGSTTIATASGVTSATTTVAVSVTPQSFSNLWGAGSVSGSIFTGSSSDTGITVYATGRDIDSGTRATALAETGFGLKGSGAAAVTGAVQQVYPLDSSNNVVGNVGTNEIESFEQVPASSVDGISLNAGDGGYASGGNLAKGLSVTIDASSNPQTVLIGYLGVSDAYSALTASGTNRHPATLLAYNGSSFNPAGSTTANGFATTTDINKVYYGQYTFWSYEQVYYNSNNAGSNGLQDSLNPSSIVSSLVTQLKNDNVDVLSSAGVHLNSMVVSRSDDGLQVD
jgi:hypothetical protein